MSATVKSIEEYKDRRTLRHSLLAVAVLVIAISSCIAVVFRRHNSSDSPYRIVDPADFVDDNDEIVGVVKDLRMRRTDVVIEQEGRPRCIEITSSDESPWDLEVESIAGDGAPLIQRIPADGEDKIVKRCDLLGRCAPNSSYWTRSSSGSLLFHVAVDGNWHEGPVEIQNPETLAVLARLELPESKTVFLGGFDTDSGTLLVFKGSDNVISSWTFNAGRPLAQSLTFPFPPCKSTNTMSLLDVSESGRFWLFRELQHPFGAWVVVYDSESGQLRRTRGSISFKSVVWDHSE